MPPAEVHAWAESHLGPFQVLLKYQHDHAYSELWRLEAQGQRFWLKMHRYPAKFAGELHGLTQWGNHLTPRVVAQREDPMAMLLTELPGEAARLTHLEPAAERRLWSEAGDYLRGLHARKNDWFGSCRPDGSPFTDAHQDVSHFVLQTFENRLRQGADGGYVTPEEAAYVAELAPAWSIALKGTVPTAVHRDSSPRNWLVLPSGELSGVIDFEHSRWDVAGADLNRWWDDEFIQRDDLRDAFFEAYGPPDERMRAEIQTMRLLHNFGSYVWASMHGLHDFAARTRAGLHRMMAETRA